MNLTNLSQKVLVAFAVVGIWTTVGNPLLCAQPAARTQAKEKTPEGPEALMGKTAPNFKVDLLEGGNFDLAEHRDKHIILLDFWATWCGPCRMAMPALVDVAKEYKNQNVLYFAVNLREEPDAIRQFLKKEKLDIHVPLDKTGDVASQYGVKGIPTMVIIDKQGLIQKVHVGYSPELKAELKKSLDKLLTASKR